MSKGMEKLLKRMIVPKVDLRCDATDALTDAYWGGDIEVISHSTFLPLLNLRYVPASKRFHFVLSITRTLLQRPVYFVPVCHIRQGDKIGGRELALVAAICIKELGQREFHPNT
jgi:hypothetical protein